MNKSIKIPNVADFYDPNESQFIQQLPPKETPSGSGEGGGERDERVTVLIVPDEWRRDQKGSNFKENFTPSLRPPTPFVDCKFIVISSPAYPLLLAPPRQYKYYCLRVYRITAYYG